MKRIAIFAPILLAMSAALAQGLAPKPLPSFKCHIPELEENISCSWTCRGRENGWTAYIDATGQQLVGDWECPNSQFGTPRYEPGICEGDFPAATCYPPGHPGPERRSSGKDPAADRGENALIAGTLAMTGVILAKTLLPELPEGASFRPHANVGFRNGTAYTVAGFTAEWEDWRVSVASSHHGAGWARPSGRLDYRVEWAF